MCLEEANVLDFNELSERLQIGQAALFPTDTLPALASLPEKSSHLWKIKKRPITKPFILMGSSTEQLLDFVLQPKQLLDFVIKLRVTLYGA